MNAILKISTHATILTKSKADAVAAANNADADDGEVFVVREMNAAQKTFVVDVYNAGVLEFTL